MERRDFNLKIKSIDDAGTFVGMGAVYNNVDLGGDLIEPGAFTRTLSAGRKWPVLWQHQVDNPIGFCQITDTREGLQVNGTLELSDPTARKAFTFMKSGIIRGLSIGYDTIQATYDGDVRHLTELKLWEISCVTFPMNGLATISSVKSITDADRARHMKAIDSHRKTIDRSQRAIREHLKAMFDGLDDEDDTNLPDDPALFEGDEEMGKAVLMAELKKLAEQAASLTAV